MQDVNADTVDGYVALVGVNYKANMSVDLQNTVVRNTAFQGYMWTPCLNQAKVLPTGTYWFNLLIPNTNLDICVKAFTTDITPHAVYYSLYREDVIIEEDQSVMVGEYFYDRISGYITEVSKGGKYLKLKVYQDTLDVYPFTVFYRIRS